MGFMVMPPLLNLHIYNPSETLKLLFIRRIKARHRLEGALWSNDALRGQLVDATSVLDPLLGDAAARLLRPDPKRRMTAEQLRLLLSGVQVAEEAEPATDAQVATGGAAQLVRLRTRALGS